MFNLIYDMWGGAVKNLLSYFFVAIHPVHHASDGVNLCYTSFKRIVSNMSLKTIQKDEHTLAQISSFSEDKLSKSIWDKILHSCHGVDGNNVDGSASSL